MERIKLVRNSYKLSVILLTAILLFSTMHLANVAKAAPVQFSLEGFDNVKGEYTTGVVRGWAEDDWVPFKLTIDNTGGEEAIGTVVIDLAYKIAAGAREGAMGIDAFRSDTGATLKMVSVDGVDTSTTITFGTDGSIDTLRFSFPLTVPAGVKILVSWQTHLSITSGTEMGASFWPGARLHVQAGVPGIVEGKRSVPIMRPEQTGPIIPPESVIGGRKFDDANGTTMHFSFDSDREPIWGDMYVKGGQSEIWNMGFTNPEYDPMTPAANGSVDSHILVPDSESGNIVPEPASLLMLGSGLAVLVVRRRYMRN